jgi:hypothetical protein
MKIILLYLQYNIELMYHLAAIHPVGAEFPSREALCVLHHIIWFPEWRATLQQYKAERQYTMH